MSEDIYIKLVAREGVAEAMSKTALKTSRKAALVDVTQRIHTSAMFELAPNHDIVKRNEYRYTELTVRYPRTQADISSLRPDLKLDIPGRTAIYLCPVAGAQRQ